MPRQENYRFTGCVCNRLMSGYYQTYMEMTHYIRSGALNGAKGASGAREDSGRRAERQCSGARRLP
jgi:hypothetical protein